MFVEPEAAALYWGERPARKADEATLEAMKETLMSNFSPICIEFFYLVHVFGWHTTPTTAFQPFSRKM